MTLSVYGASGFVGGNFCRLFGDKVVHVQQSLDQADSGVADVHSHPLRQHADLGDVVSDVSSSPSEEFLDHHFELILHQGAVG